LSGDSVPKSARVERHFGFALSMRDGNVLGFSIVRIALHIQCRDSTHDTSFAPPQKINTAYLKNVKM